MESERQLTDAVDLKENVESPRPIEQIKRGKNGRSKKNAMENDDQYIFGMSADPHCTDDRSISTMGKCDSGITSDECTESVLSSGQASGAASYTPLQSDVGSQLPQLVENISIAKDSAIHEDHELEDESEVDEACDGLDTSGSPGNGKSDNYDCDHNNSGEFFIEKDKCEVVVVRVRRKILERKVMKTLINTDTELESQESKQDTTLSRNNPEMDVISELKTKSEPDYECSSQTKDSLNAEMTPEGAYKGNDSSSLSRRSSRAGLFLHRVFKRSTQGRKCGNQQVDLRASEITMNGQELNDLMISVKEGKLTQDDAIREVERHKLIIREKEPSPTTRRISESAIPSMDVRKAVLLPHSPSRHKVARSSSFLRFMRRKVFHGEEKEGLQGVTDRVRSSTRQSIIIVKSQTQEEQPMASDSTQESPPLETFKELAENPISNSLSKMHNKQNNEITGNATNTANNDEVDSTPAQNIARDDCGALVMKEYDRRRGCELVPSKELGSLAEEAEAGCLQEPHRMSKNSASIDEDATSQISFVGVGRANTDWTGSAYDKESLSFKKGDIIYIIRKNESGIWKGMVNDKIGEVKFVHVDLLPEVPEKPTEKKKISFVRRSYRRSTPNSVEELLKRLGFLHLLHKFLLCGFETLELFRQLDERDLDNLEINDQDERTKLLTVASLLGEGSRFLNLPFPTTLYDDESIDSD